MSLLEVKDLKTYFTIEDEIVPAVDGVSFKIEEGEILALVGESGSGKSVTAMSIMGLIREPGKVVGGEILFNDQNLLQKREKEMCRIRGNEISMVYQNPMSSLHPMIRIGDQVSEALIIHQKLSKTEAKKESIRMMELVGIPDAANRYRDYPSQFSGGMRQRIMIAMAIVCMPKVLIADEPTTALDVTIQAEILELLRKLIKEYGLSILLITHDLGVVAEMADRVCVMYCGKIMEDTTRTNLFRKPLNPYTQGLIKCIPRTDDKAEVLYTIGGNVPHPSDFPNGCRFSTRCQQVMARCKEEMPPLTEVDEKHKVRCWLYHGEAEQG